VGGGAGVGAGGAGGAAGAAGSVAAVHGGEGRGLGVRTSAAEARWPAIIAAVSAASCTDRAFICSRCTVICS